MTPEQQLYLTLAAVGIAGVSLLISFFSLGWNVYRDVILKARLNLRFSLSQIHHETFPKPLTTLVFSVTNHGPGRVKLSMIQLKTAPLWRRLFRCTKHAVLLHDYENPLSGKLPAWLDVGEGTDLLIRYDQECFLSEDITHVGISDSFSRVHWAPQRQVSKARKDFKRDFKKEEGEQAESTVPSEAAPSASSDVR